MEAGPAFPRLVLASSSPRRRQLLENLQVPFDVFPPSEDAEQPLPLECPAERIPELVCAAALAKARSVAEALEEGRLVLAADTVVAAGDRLLGKPHGPEEARAMLRQLSGRCHAVITGVAVVESGPAPGRSATGHERTEVLFVPLDEEDLQRYVDSGEPLDKAGAYGIQGLGGLLVERIEGCYFNVVGLPLSRVDRLLRTFGTRLRS